MVRMISAAEPINLKDLGCRMGVEQVRHKGLEADLVQA